MAGLPDWPRLRRGASVRERFAAGRPVFLVLMTILLLAGSAALFGWGGDESYKVWPYRTSVHGTVVDDDLSDLDDISVLLRDPPHDLAVHADSREGGPRAYATFASTPRHGATVTLRCYVDDDGHPDDVCIDDGTYDSYRHSAVVDAIAPGIALLAILVILATYVVTGRRWLRVYRTNPALGRRELVTGATTFAAGVVLTVGWFYLALLRATS